MLACRPCALGIMSSPALPSADPGEGRSSRTEDYRDACHSHRLAEVLRTSGGAISTKHWYCSALLSRREASPAEAGRGCSLSAASILRKFDTTGCCLSTLIDSHANDLPVVGTRTRPQHQKRPITLPVSGRRDIGGQFIPMRNQDSFEVLCVRSAQLHLTPCTTVVQKQHHAGGVSQENQKGSSLTNCWPVCLLR